MSEMPLPISSSTIHSPPPHPPPRPAPKNEWCKRDRARRDQAPSATHILAGQADFIAIKDKEVSVKMRTCELFNKWRLRCIYMQICVLRQNPFHFARIPHCPCLAAHGIYRNEERLGSKQLLCRFNVDAALSYR